MFAWILNKKVCFKTYLYTHLFDLWSKSREKVKYQYSCKVFKFQRMVQEIQMKRANRDILTYLLANLLTYILTYEHTYWPSKSQNQHKLWLKKQNRLNFFLRLFIYEMGYCMLFSSYSLTLLFNFLFTVFNFQLQCSSADILRELNFSAFVWWFV